MTPQDSYDKIDRLLRNNLNDEDYAEYSEALDYACGLNLPLESSQEAQDAIAVIMKDYNYPLNPANCARVGWRAARLYIKQ